MPNTRLDAQNRYDEIIDIMTPGSPTYNPFIDNYIDFKIRNKMKYFFGNIENWLGRETWEWNDENRIATEIITSCDVIEDYITFLETILTSGGGAGTGDITGSGTAGRIALWDANKNITSDGEILYDSTNDILAVKNITHNGNYKENVIVVNSDTTLDTTHSHIVCVNNQNVIVDGLSDGNANGEYVFQPTSQNQNGSFIIYSQAYINPNGYYIAPYASTNGGYQWRIYSSVLTFQAVDQNGEYMLPSMVISWLDILLNPLPNVHVTSKNYEITLPTITSANVKIRYDLKNISSEVVNITTDGTQKFDGDVITDLTLGVGNQITLVATEISTGVYTWVTFN
jgi:hypothetical protein